MPVPVRIIPVVLADTKPIAVVVIELIEVT